MTNLKPILTLSLSVAFAATGYAQTWNFLKIDPKATYLRDSQFAPTASKLELDGNQGTELQGRFIRFRTVGWFNRAADNPGARNIANEAVAVFSATGDLDTDWSLRYRVDQPKDTGADFYTLPTWIGSQPTDIDEDFVVASEVVRVEIPDGARFVLFTPFDNGFWNNEDDFSMPGADPRGFGIEWQVIQTVPEPSGLAALSIAAALLRRLRRRR